MSTATTGSASVARVKLTTSPQLDEARDRTVRLFIERLVARR
jgi:hypothetical protein